VTWNIFTGSGEPSRPDAWKTIPPPPPWRRPGQTLATFVMAPGLLDAVNAALHLRRPLLLTGNPGTGKSTLVSYVARELALGQVLTWHVTSRSTLTDALYQYDALGRLNATQEAPGATTASASRIENFVTLGPLGTALACPERPRAVLIDEIDKCDLDLPGDLLHVLELGQFPVPPLAREAGNDADTGAQDGRDGGATILKHHVRGCDRELYSVSGGVVKATHLPFIVLTSNAERTFPGAFLRRCVRFDMPTPTEQFLRDLVQAHLGALGQEENDEIRTFWDRLQRQESLALDQLLNYVYLVTGEAAPDTDSRNRVRDVVLANLSGR
jgi:MoxR-like ATPase